MSGPVWRSGRVQRTGPYLLLDLISSPLSASAPHPSLAVKACAPARYRQFEPRKMSNPDSGASQPSGLRQVPVSFPASLLYLQDGDLHCNLPRLMLIKD